MRPEAPPVEAGEFWRSFQARASTLPRTEVVGDVLQMPVWHPWRWSAAAAAAVLLVVGVWLMPERDIQQRAAVGLDPVQSLRISAPYSAVFILNDADSDSTIIWIADMSQPLPSK